MTIIALISFFEFWNITSINHQLFMLFIKDKHAAINNFEYLLGADYLKVFWDIRKHAIYNKNI